ncbi:BRO family protein [Paenibacillus dendritiformis]|uniref:BRO family protein n=1 Tax=Paenibacillus dendritiformis TaxID=130049 RepID=UPI0015EBB870|nr:BRO family protein [Paenibacillus dendritiformis]
MNQLQVFNFVGNEIRVVTKDGQPWWVAKDVCDVLDLSNPSMALKALDEDERAKLNLGRQGEVNIVNEPGLYSLILGSRKPEAKQFKRWITHEVIPAIRKTGTYSISSLSPELQAIFVHDEKLQILDGRIGKLENTMTIDYAQQRALRKLGNNVVMVLVGGKNSVAYKKFASKAFNELWKHYKNTFNIESYCDTPSVEFERGKEVLRNWKPSEELRYAIIGANAEQLVSN